MPHWPSCRVMISRGIALQTWARQPGPAGVTAQTKAWQPDAQDVESERSPRFLTPVFGLRVCSAGLPAAGGPGCPTWVSFPPRHLQREFGTGAERGHAPYCPPASAPRLRGNASWGCRVATCVEGRREEGRLRCVESATLFIDWWESLLNGAAGSKPIFFF